DHLVNNADLQALLTKLASSGSVINNAQMVVDANGAPAIGSSPANLTAMGNAVYFTSNDAAHGNELWKTDGTAAGSMLLKDVWLGAQNSDPSGLSSVGRT